MESTINFKVAFPSIVENELNFYEIRFDVLDNNFENFKSILEDICCDCHTP